MALTLATSVKYLKGVGPRRAEALARLGIRTVGDLLYHAPHRYVDATTLVPLARAQVGAEVTCLGQVISTGVLPTRRGLRVFRAILRDASGSLECAWPGQPFLERQVRQGQWLLVTGPVRFYHGRQLAPREFIVLAEEGDEPPAKGLILPVYPATEGLTHRQVRAWSRRPRSLIPSRPIRTPGCAMRRRSRTWRALAFVHPPTTLDEAEQGAAVSRSTSCSTSSWCTRGRGTWPSGRGRGSASRFARS
jgi:ATP-dependent DNA helicase RecG